jgi:hypothetical protein
LVTTFVLVITSILIFAFIIFVNAILFSLTDVFPVRYVYNIYYGILAKYQLHWRGLQGGMICRAYGEHGSG